MTIFAPIVAAVARKVVFCQTPVVSVRAATAPQRAQAGIWSALSGHDCFDVVEYADGDAQHAPEVVAALRGLYQDTPSLALLLYVHRGQQARCMMPLLPKLLFQTGYHGISHGLRFEVGPDEPFPAARIDRFASGQMQPGARCLLVEDRQMRIGPIGTVSPAPVTLSILEHIGVSGASAY